MSNLFENMMSVTEVQVGTETVVLCKVRAKTWQVLDMQATVLHTGSTKREATAYIDRLKSAAKTLEERKPEVLTTVEDKPEPAKTERVKQNGVTRPKAGGKCAAVWEWLDAHPGATAKDARGKASAEGWNINNTSAEYYQWRKFMGISGRVKAAS